MRVKRYRRPRNSAEGECYDELAKRGFLPSKRGWPDFFCTNEDETEVCVVEVKKDAEEPLKYEQYVVMKILQKYGIKCYVYKPETGLVEFDASQYQRGKEGQKSRFNKIKDFVENEPYAKINTGENSLEDL